MLFFLTAEKDGKIIFHLSLYMKGITVHTVCFAVCPPYLWVSVGECQWILFSAQQGRAVLLLGRKILKNSYVDIALDWGHKRYHQVEINKTNRN